MAKFTPDPSSDLYRLLLSIDSWQREVNSRWRVAEDPVDALVEMVEDRFLAHSDDPGCWVRWARVVYRNLLKKGPQRVEESSRRVSSLDADSLAEIERTEQDPVVPLSAWRRSLHCLLPRLKRTLTPAELRCLYAALSASSMAEASRLSSCTPRDLRVRFRRISEKAKALLSSPPPHLMRSDASEQSDEDTLSTGR